MEKINLDENSQTIDTTQSHITSQPKPIFPILIGLGIVLGLGLGILLARQGIQTTDSATSTLTGDMPEDPSAVKVGKIYGSQDEDIFPDKAEGIVVAGGVNGEGSHHLVRPGGDSQNVYISSSVVDLDTLVGARVQVWGQTMSAKKAGWLMDVGRLKLLELDAPMPE
jgi:hypothetical protein